ncbi:IclR family transcriptional regulator [Camelimonas abortus]|uniref:IclR family transcriptional regulator n=1 Tax=Camelimonas abortus TaxID=1017184 RepID=A0ABV7LAF8_9HYPH
MSETDDSPLGRSFRILELLAGAPDGLSLSEIAAATGLVAATVHRQLGTLVGVGAVQKLNARVFTLGERMWRIAALMTGDADVATTAAPVLKELVDAFGETAFLARLVNAQVEILATRTPEGRGQSYVQPGNGMPLHAAASGKILLSMQSDEFVSRYLQLPRQAYTPNTRIAEDDIRRDIASARARKIAICDNEFDPGILSYATAVQDPRTGLCYALTVFGLADRFSQIPAETVETVLLAAGDRLARSLRDRRPSPARG